MINIYKAKPFIKWVGGKGQLIPQLKKALPEILQREDFTYIEPFVGGGAMLFFMLRQFPNIKNVVINDINKNLIDAYFSIKDRPEELIRSLKAVEKEYKSLLQESARKDFFLAVRKRFNEENLEQTEKTAMLIFLNRTCFNGLYRENMKGKFNVPFGRYTNPTICNEEVIYADSELLNLHNVRILNGDFLKTRAYIAKQGLTFFYFDPPYRPLNSTSNFNSYVKEVFDDARQSDLADFCRMLSMNNNCLWMLSNSDCSAVNPQNLFFENKYKGFDIQRVYASRSVNAVCNKRGKISELLIRNYGKDMESEMNQAI